ncbi:MAG: calcium/sodium antiporter [Alistipes sp.]|nr:calcium/sodium antiporter [Alistipes sp.]
MDIVYILIGLALVVYGANIMTDGASGIATRFGVSEFIVGLTVVAIGTSAPELVVSLLSAFRGEDAIAVGNVVGSNLFNTLVIVGITAIITPLALTSDNVRKDIPFGVLATVVLIIYAGDVWLDHSAAPVISRSEGLSMLCFFAVFIAYSVYSGLGSGRPVLPGSMSGAGQGLETGSVSSPQSDGMTGTGFETAGGDINERLAGSAVAAGEDVPAPHVPEMGKKERRMWLLVVMTLGGLAALVVGGELFLDGAVALAHKFAISDTVIAVTIVAGGTSLPELAASVVAAVKKKPGIALGNILGSNVLNIFMVLGASATVAPLKMGEIGLPDLLVVFFAASLLFVAAFTLRKKTDRPYGRHSVRYTLYSLYYMGPEAVIPSVKKPDNSTGYPAF